MDNLRSIVSMACNNFKKWNVNPRIYIILLGLFVYLYSRVVPIKEFCATFGYPITPHVFPFLMSDQFSVMLIMLGVVLLFCDAPFIENEQPYSIIRSGRKAWLFSQLLYIVLASAVYFIVVIFISIIVLLPNVEFSLGWGKVIGTFAQTNVAPNHGISLNFDYYIMNSYTPVQAMLSSFLLAWLMGILLGVLMFTLNLCFSRAAGAIAASLLILLQMAVRSEMNLFRFSPVSWVSLSRVDIKGTTVFPSYPYILIISGIAILVLTAVSLVSIKNRDIEILKSI